MLTFLLLSYSLRFVSIWSLFRLIFLTFSSVACFWALNWKRAKQRYFGICTFHTSGLVDRSSRRPSSTWPCVRCDVLSSVYLCFFFVLTSIVFVSRYTQARLITHHYPPPSRWMTNVRHSDQSSFFVLNKKKQQQRMSLVASTIERKKIWSLWGSNSWPPRY